MQTMQNFHNWLFSQSDETDNYRKTLIRLSQANLDQLKAIASDLVWLPWETAEAKTANP